MVLFIIIDISDGKSDYANSKAEPEPSNWKYSEKLIPRLTSEKIEMDAEMPEV